MPMHSHHTVIDRSRRAAPRVPALIGALAGVTLLVAGCGGGGSNPGVASVKTTTTPTSGAGAPSAASARQSGLLYARCMRAHGVSNFPDPTTGGGFDAPTNIKSNPRYRSARQSCQSDLPNGGPADKRLQINVERAVELARCMRSHGVVGLPDPSSQGAITMPASIDPDSSRFETAQHTCEKKYGPVPIAISAGEN